MRIFQTTVSQYTYKNNCANHPEPKFALPATVNLLSGDSVIRDILQILPTDCDK